MFKDAKKLLVISSYPAQGTTHGKETVGVASYTKNTLLALSKQNQELDISVLAEKLKNVSQNIYTEGNIRVKRIWKRGSFFSFWVILKEIIKNHKHDRNLLLELELAMFGGVKNLLALPLFLTALNLLGKKTTVVLHQVIPDMNAIAGHINQKKNSPLIFFYNFGIQNLYRLILSKSNRVIVFDQILKDKLAPFGSQHKIIVIPHGVEKFEETTSRQIARQKLNLPGDQFIALSFGYLAWYKGTDWLVDTIISKARDTRDTLLILAGGPNPNHLDKKWYRDYIADIEKKCKDSGIIITGFIPEDKIGLYYKASDVILLPYRTLMSASGPLSIALSHKNPFLVSKRMEDIFETADAQKSLEECSVSKNALVFEDKKDLLSKLENLQKSKSALSALASFSENLGKKRSWDKIGKMYIEVLFK